MNTWSQVIPAGAFSALNWAVNAPAADAGPTVRARTRTSRQIAVGEADASPAEISDSRSSNGPSALAPRGHRPGAIAFIDEFGVQSLSMRRLGMSLEVEAMALYNYVSGREELVSLAVDELIDDLFDDELMKERPASWEAYLRFVANAMRDLALSHPRMFPLMITQPPEAVVRARRRARALGRLLPLHPAGLRLLR